MNVLFVWDGPANGDERSVLARREIPLIREMNTNGHRVAVALAGDRGGLATDLRAAGIETAVLPAPLPPAAAALATIAPATIHLRRVMTRIRPDLVEATEAMPAIASGVAAMMMRPRPVIVYRRQHSGGRTRRFLAGRVATLLTDATIVSCEAMRTRSEIDDRRERARIHIATPGTAEPRTVTTAEVLAARHSLGIYNGTRIIGAISRFRREKGLDLLIRAVARLRGDHDVQLLLAGTGPEETKLRLLAQQTGVRAHFVGHQDDVALWMQVADVIAIPSRRESFGRTTLEAMAAARPIVATRVGGLAEAIEDGTNGALADPDDEESLASALRRVIGDDALAARYASAAREKFMSRYTIAHMAERRVASWAAATAGAR